MKLMNSAPVIYASKASKGVQDEQEYLSHTENNGNLRKTTHYSIRNRRGGNLYHKTTLIDKNADKLFYRMKDSEHHFSKRGQPDDIHTFQQE